METGKPLNGLPYILGGTKGSEGQFMDVGFGRSLSDERATNGRYQYYTLNQAEGTQECRIEVQS